MSCVRAFPLAVLIPILLLSHTVSEAQSLSAPTALSATTYSKKVINLAWDDPNPSLSGAQEGGYIVERAKATPTSWSKVFTSGPNVTSWSSTGLSTGILYYYRVRAFAVVGGTTVYSPYSSYASATTQSSAYPNPATNLAATALSATQIALKWSDKAGNEAGYEVQRAPASTGPWSEIGYTQTNQVTFTDSGLTSGTAYFYRVVATNTTGDSPPSNVATATTKPAPPAISTQPASATVTAPATATFSVTATGTAPLGYQWQKNGVNIAGATGASYTTPSTSTADSGSTFLVVVSNSAGTATSNAATLTVNAAAAATDLVGFVPGIGTPRDVVVDPVKGLAYMASDQFGLAVVDVSNPAAPVAIGGANPPFYGNRLAVNGTLAGVGSSAGLYVVDVSVPTAPETVGFLSGYIQGIAMAGQYAYVLVGVSGTLPRTDLAVVDLYLPARPTIVGRVTLANGMDVTVVGSFAYVAAGGAGLQIVDVSNPAVPWIVSTLDTPGGGGSLAVANGHAYIADRTSLQVVNVGSPSNPYVVGALPTTSATAVAVTGSLLYVLDGSQLKIVDVTSPAVPLLLGSTDGRGAQRLAAAGTEAFLSSPSTGFSVIEASVPTAPVLLGNVSGGFENSDVAVAGSLAVVTGGSFGLKVLDVTVPTAPEVIGFLSGNMKAVAMAGQYAYVLLGVSGTLPRTDLAVVDLQLPATPTIVGRVTLANGIHVKVVGSFAYVAAGGAGLQIVDVSNPAAPWIVSTLDTPGGGGSLAVANGHAYIADRTSIQVINVSNPASPVFVGSLATTAATAVAVAGSRLYVLDGALFEVIDVTNPAAPVLLSATPNPGAQALDVTGTLAFLATPASLHTSTNPVGGLYVLDVSIPTTPTLVDLIIVPGLTRTVVATPSFVYAGDSSAILDVIGIAP